jgi:hypothetical protein
MNEYLKNIFRFFIILALQVFVLNRIELRWWSQPTGFPLFVPYLYPVFILLLPIETPVWALLLIGFFTGITVDSFSNTAGMHACATVLIAYLRTNVLNALLPKALEDYPDQSPGVKNMGWVPFIVYAGFLLLIHHAIFFTVELWSFDNRSILLLKIFASTVTSLLMVLIYLLLFTKETR